MMSGRRVFQDKGTGTSSASTRAITRVLRNSKVTGTERTQGRLLEMRSVRYPSLDHVQPYCPF